MSVESSSHYRKPPPPSSSPAAVESDAPVLAALLATSPDLHIYAASAPAFNDVHHVFDQTVITPPLVAIRPTCEAEVVRTVKFCKDNGITMSIRTGGLDVGARSRMPDPKGVMLDMRSIDHLSVNTETKIAKVGGGVVCGSVLEFLNEQGLTTPTAFVGGVGYTAFACGGGYGLLSGMLGLGADNIVGARLVLASGEIVDTADAEADPEIMWALRGCGGGVLGVLTELRIRAHTCPPCLGGFVIFPFAEIEPVMDGLQKIGTEIVHGKLAGDMMVVNTPGIGPTATYIYFWALNEDKSDLEEAKGYLDRICKLGSVIASTVTETTPWDFTDTIPNPVGEKRLAFNVCSRTVDGYSAELGRVIASHPIHNESSAIVIHNCHGKATQANPDASYANRRNHLAMGISGNGPFADMESKPELRNWAIALGENIKEAGLSTDWSYVNFTPPTKRDGLMYYGDEGVKRLKKLKDKLDPDWYFTKGMPDLDV